MATTVADGQIGVYLDRASMRSDKTGEHARYTIRDVAEEREAPPTNEDLGYDLGYDDDY